MEIPAHQHLDQYVDRSAFQRASSIPGRSFFQVSITIHGSVDKIIWMQHFIRSDQLFPVPNIVVAKVIVAFSGIPDTVSSDIIGEIMIKSLNTR